ncbi:polysaccharide pyruvyl transferase family protein [Akkermansiaceae bacterium]|nr:polysaccharide pyruvyl transferase family protein [Akkermansiaceae bacterium]
MIIEISGTNTANKGAELMLCAVLAQLGSCKDISAIVVDRSFGSPVARAQYRLGLQLEIQKWGRSRLALKLMPGSFRKMVNVVREREVDVLLDASGFAFGDQLPLERAEGFLSRVRRAKAQRQKVILLPQAFGPFKSHAHASCFKRIIPLCDLIYARDRQSLAALQLLAPEAAQIQMAPDFTIGVKPELHAAGAASSERIAIVPNDRMLEYAPSPEAADAYVNTFAAACRVCLEQGLKPFILVHSGPDQEVGRRVNAMVGAEIEILNLHDPVQIKRVLGECRLVIASRFHAIVSALTQNVPVIATSWSHKYEELLGEYGCAHTILDAYKADEEQVRNLLGGITGEAYSSLVGNIDDRNTEVKAAVAAMWEAVFGCIQRD